MDATPRDQTPAACHVDHDVEEVIEDARLHVAHVGSVRGAYAPTP